MSTHEQRALVSEYIAWVWNQGDPTALEELTAPSFSYRLGDQPPRDRKAMREFLESTRTAFPDWRVDIADLVLGEELVAVRWVGTVTHQGPFYGIPPTGRRIRVSGINLYRIADGRVYEEWEQTDSLSMLRQLGVLPPEPPALAPDAGR